MDSKVGIHHYLRCLVGAGPFQKSPESTADNCTIYAGQEVTHYPHDTLSFKPATYEALDADSLRCTACRPYAHLSSSEMPGPSKDSCELARAYKLGIVAFSNCPSL